MSIPVVDFGDYSLDKHDVTDERLQELSQMLGAAFTDFGFVFLKNTGITREEVENAMAVGLKFFLQPDDMKKPFSRGTFPVGPNHGWVSAEAERLNPLRPGDLKESFNISSLHPDIKWPLSVSNFEKTQVSFFQRCKELSLRVLRVLAQSVGVDPDVFLNAHKSIGTSKNGSALRCLYYSPVNSDKVKENQVRCGEHTDYGSLTLLFQSSEGLQVLTHSGEFISVPCIPDAVLVNIADLMQRWTSDQFVSVCCTGLLPPAGDSSTRQSLAFFAQPDDDALITCCDGSNKYPPIRSRDHYMERYSVTYGKS
ncbi:UPF0676 protein C1494.01-like isoform X2 [Cynoglossus semilaevis]|uniref:UPF0676 protein C1494.01-like isoform X2 n=1 Tax=Cynoglossus semilaevis TaxID=244447 RepID=UPI0007DC936A|nr:UPF0676 protein C1494.01-like isoform X2 [Cynoglossus semilaevis]